jgi:hypothetical protein
MSSLELRNQTYRIVFMYGGRKYGSSLDTGSHSTAPACCPRPPRSLAGRPLLARRHLPQPGGRVRGLLLESRGL